MADAAETVTAEKPIAETDVTRMSRDDLVRDNVRYRERHKRDLARVAEVEAKLPKAGHVAVPQADADELVEWRKLGAKPSEAAAKLTAGEQAAAALAERAELEQIEAGAGAHGVNGKVLARLGKSEGFAVELRDETVDGKVVKVAYAKKGDAQAEPLLAFIDAHLADFKPALMAGAAAGTGTGNGSGSQQSGPRGGSPFPRLVDASRVPPVAPTPQERVREKLASGMYGSGI